MDGPTAGDVTLALLNARAPGATICPSEVARALVSDRGEWRDAMPDVHAAIDWLVADGMVQLSWKSRPLAIRDGPYRIARIQRDLRRDEA